MIVSKSHMKQIGINNKQINKNDSRFQQLEHMYQHSQTWYAKK